jgi:internalin A
LKANEEGSVDLYFGLDAPNGSYARKYSCSFPNKPFQENLVYAIKSVIKEGQMKNIQYRMVALVVLFVVIFYCGCGDRGNNSDSDETTSSVPQSNKADDQPTELTVDEVHAAIKKMNPAYNGRGYFQINDGKVVAAVLAGTGVTDLTPLKGMPIKALDLRGLPLNDLTVLHDMPLKELYLEDTDVVDLRPLQGMQLITLYLNNTKVKDLSPLLGMPLKQLNLFGTNVEDLSVLQGMPLEMLWLNETPVSDISPISACPIKSLTLHKTGVSDLTPLSNMVALERLHIAETFVNDLMPIKNLNLTRLIYTPKNITTGNQIPKEMKSLRELGTTFENRMSPEVFWKLYEEGKLN